MSVDIDVGQRNVCTHNNALLSVPCALKHERGTYQQLKQLSPLREKNNHATKNFSWALTENRNTEDRASSSNTCVGYTFFYNYQGFRPRCMELGIAIYNPHSQWHFFVFLNATITQVTHFSQIYSIFKINDKRTSGLTSRMSSLSRIMCKDVHLDR